MKSGLAWVDNSEPDLLILLALTSCLGEPGEGGDYEELDRGFNLYHTLRTILDGCT